jgi:hypothetical protein
MGDILKVVWTEFSTLRYAVFVISVTEWHGPACPHLELKTQSRFSPLPWFSPISFHAPLSYNQHD